MPSKAFTRYKSKLISDVNALIETHAELNPPGRGRRSLGHITRGAVVMLCAAWEIYLEEVIRDSVRYLSEHTPEPKVLPKAAAKELSKFVKNHDHELKPLDLAIDGWKITYQSLADVLIASFNTPKSGPANELFRRTLGVSCVSDWWSVGTETVDDFVSVRGEIAHRGSDANYTTLVDLQKYLEQINTSVLDTDNALCDYLKSCDGAPDSPWRRRTTF